MRISLTVDDKLTAHAMIALDVDTHTEAISEAPALVVRKHAYKEILELRSLRRNRCCHRCAQENRARGRQVFFLVERKPVRSVCANTAFFDRSARPAALVAQHVSDVEAQDKIMSLLAERFRAQRIRAGMRLGDIALAMPRG